MRKQPRRLPSSSPSLAWVAFAVLLLSIAGGIGGLYAHRQNQETTKKQFIGEMEEEIAGLRDKTAALQGEFDGRIGAAQLKHTVSERKIPLVAIDPSRRHLVTPDEIGGDALPDQAAVVVAGSP